MAASLLLVAPAVAGGPDRLAEAIGSQLQVSCLSADRCMLSGGAHLSGALTRVVDGRRVDTYLEPAQEILSVSCPGRAGCLAIGPTVAGNGVVNTNAGGRTK